jgi:hypothetical protein
MRQLLPPAYEDETGHSGTADQQEQQQLLKANKQQDVRVVTV